MNMYSSLNITLLYNGIFLPVKPKLLNAEFKVLKHFTAFGVKSCDLNQVVLGSQVKGHTPKINWQMILNNLIMKVT